MQVQYIEREVRVRWGIDIICSIYQGNFYMLVGGTTIWD